MSPFEIAYVSIVAVSTTVMGINLRIWYKSRNRQAKLLLISPFKWDDFPLIGLKA